jgi:hypothetical protein
MKIYLSLLLLTLTPCFAQTYTLRLEQVIATGAEIEVNMNYQTFIEFDVPIDHFVPVREDLLRYQLVGNKLWINAIAEAGRVGITPIVDGNGAMFNITINPDMKANKSYVVESPRIASPKVMGTLNNYLNPVPTDPQMNSNGERPLDIYTEPATSYDTPQNTLETAPQDTQLPSPEAAQTTPATIAPNTETSITTPDTSPTEQVNMVSINDPALPFIFSAEKANTCTDNLRDCTNFTVIRYDIRNLEENAISNDIKRLRITQDGTSVRFRQSRIDTDGFINRLSSGDQEQGTLVTEEPVSGPITFTWELIELGTGKKYTISETFN